MWDEWHSEVLIVWGWRAPASLETFRGTCQSETPPYYPEMRGLGIYLRDMSLYIQKKIHVYIDTDEWIKECLLSNTRNNQISISRRWINTLLSEVVWMKTAHLGSQGVELLEMWSWSECGPSGVGYGLDGGSVSWGEGGGFQDAQARPSVTVSSCRLWIKMESSQLLSSTMFTCLLPRFPPCW